MLQTRVLGGPATSIGVYAKRRFLRIAPAYWLALTVVALIIVPPISGVFTKNWWVYYGLLQNYPVYKLTPDCVGIGRLACGISPTWSLAIEVIFYAVLPIFAIGMAWLTKRVRLFPWLTVELFVLAVLSAVSVVIQAQYDFSDAQKWLFFSPLGRAWWFGLGMAMAALSVRSSEESRFMPRVVEWITRHAGLIWLGTILLYVVSALAYFDKGPLLSAPGADTVQYLVAYLLAGVIAAMFLLPAIFGRERRDGPRRAMGHPALAWLGLISYGIFLWHYPIILGLLQIGVPDWWPAARFPVMLAITLVSTIACASLSYYLVERRLMRRK